MLERRNPHFCDLGDASLIFCEAGKLFSSAQ
jgi:hypothetical protein